MTPRPIAALTLCLSLSLTACTPGSGTGEITVVDHFTDTGRMVMTITSEDIVRLELTEQGQPTAYETGPLMPGTYAEARSIVEARMPAIQAALRREGPDPVCPIELVDLRITMSPPVQGVSDMQWSCDPDGIRQLSEDLAGLVAR